MRRLRPGAPARRVVGAPEREHDNLRAALSWSLEQAGNEEAAEGVRSRETALRLAGALGRFWVVHGHISEGRTFLERALAARAGSEAYVQAKALILAGHLAFIQSDYERAEPLFEESLALYRELEDHHGRAFALSMLGSVAWTKGQMARARTLTEEALALSRQVDDLERAANALFILGLVSSSLGEYSRACTLYEESVAVHRAAGNKRGIAHALSQLAQVPCLSPRATRRGSAWCSRNVSRFRGRWASRRGLRRMLASGDSWRVVRATWSRRVPQPRRAWRSTERSDTSMGPPMRSAFWGGSASWRVMMQQRRSSTNRAWSSHASCKKNGWPPCSRRALGEVVAAQQQLAWAGQLWGAAEAIRDATGVPIPLLARAAYERSVSSARVHLGEKAFTAAWGQGRSMTPKQALAAKGQKPTPPPAATVTPPPTYPDGLTAREVEVLRLVAKGFTDAQVAEALVLSPRTAPCAPQLRLQQTGHFLAQCGDPLCH